MSPSSAVHDGQYDTKYVTFEWLLHAVFVADTIWGVLLEPAGMHDRRLSPSTIAAHCTMATKAFGIRHSGILAFGSRLRAVFF